MARGGVRRSLIDLTGQRFGRLLVIEWLPNTKGMWRCLCDCGRPTTPRGPDLLRGAATSCGCSRKGRTGVPIHGLFVGGRVPPEYPCYQAMISRCTREDDIAFDRYGGRGITICPRWRAGEDGRTGFDCFVSDLGPRPSLDHTLDRVNNDGNYEPGNVRWATRSEQAKNRRTRPRDEVGRFAGAAA